jgi:hypothetical protein
MTLWVACNGAYGQEEEKRLPDAVFAAIQTMSVRQKVLILEEKEESDGKEYREEGRKEGKI